MKIIVTGGAGFIGSCLVWKLNQVGEKEIIVVDSEESVKWGNLRGKDICDFLDKGHFLNLTKSKKIVENIKAVFHIGACTSTLEQDENYLLFNNTEYSKTVAMWALEQNIPFYYASSAATYGDGSMGYSDQEEMIPKLKPLNPYGKSKQLFDLWLLENHLLNKVVGFKYFNVFGPNEYHKEEMRSMVVKGYQQIKATGKIRLFKSYRPEYEDGEQKRDFIYVKDVVEVMYWFYQNPSVKGIYNLGTGLARSWNDLAKALFCALDLPPQIEYIEMPPILRDQYQYFTQADLTKLRKTGLNYQFTSLENAVDDYVNNYLEKGPRHL